MSFIIDEPKIRYLGGSSFQWEWCGKSNKFEVGFFDKNKLSEIYPQCREWAKQQYNLFYA